MWKKENISASTFNLKIKSLSPEKALEEVARSVGNFIEYWGFRNIHGRFWAVIFLAKNPISTADIIEKLEVSKALASRTINELLEYGLIEHAGNSEHGRHTYRAKENVGDIVHTVLRNREMVLLNESLQSFAQLAKHSKHELNSKGIDHEKLKQLTDLTQENKGLLEAFLKKRFRTFAQWIKFSKIARRFLKL